MNDNTQDPMNPNQPQGQGDATGMPVVPPAAPTGDAGMPQAPAADEVVGTPTMPPATGSEPAVPVTPEMPEPMEDETPAEQPAGEMPQQPGTGNPAQNS